MVILGIESSCDETAAAVVRDGRELLSNVIASQVDIHARYGGVVPEIASRKHIEAVAPTILKALGDAGLTLEAVDGVAVTQGPGLIGSLLVGLSTAKAIAFARRIPLVGVNHLEGHVAAVFLTPDPPAFPFIALVVSGGTPRSISWRVSDGSRCSARPGRRSRGGLRQGGQAAGHRLSRGGGDRPPGQGRGECQGHGFPAGHEGLSGFQLQRPEDLPDGHAEEKGDSLQRP
jgi:hypothetical protein